MGKIKYTPFVPSSDNMMHGANYAFFLRDDASKPAPTYYGDLIASATKWVYIWDPYFHDGDTAVFANLSNCVKVVVLTKKNARRKDVYLDGLINHTKANINSSVKGNCCFAFGFIDTDSHPQGVWQCHDRFIIIDDENFFLVGASVESHLRSLHSTGIYEVTADEDKEIIRDAYKKTFKECFRQRMLKITRI